MTQQQGLNYPADAAALRDEIRAMLKTTIADHGTAMDTGGGFGSADLWVTVGGENYLITVKSLGRQGLK